MAGGAVSFVRVDASTGEYEHLAKMKLEMGCYMDSSAVGHNEDGKPEYYILCQHLDEAAGFDAETFQGPHMISGADEASTADKAPLYFHRLTVDDIITETWVPIDETVLSISYSEPTMQLIGWKSGTGIVSVNGKTGEINEVAAGSNFHGSPNLFASACSAEEPVCYFNIQYMTESTHSVLVDVSTGEVISNTLNPGKHHWTKVFWQESL